LDIATHAPILDRVAEILGPDVLLWGAMLAVQPPGGVHPWHSDIECSAAGRTVNVWLGLDHVRRGSAVHFITRTHQLDPIQRIAAKNGVRRDQLTAATLHGWALELDRQCELVEPEVRNGEAFFFDGRIWHGSLNRNRFTSRTALLLQYAAPDARIRIPDPNRLGWPFQLLPTPRPASIMVRGTDEHGENRVVPGPVAEGGLAGPALGSRIQSLGLPLEENAETGWSPQAIFHGATPNVARIACHTSVLSAGREPHPIHSHEEEELLLMLTGEANLVIVRDGKEQTHTVREGSFAYYPAQQPHTIRNATAEPATYLIFKWWTPATGLQNRLQTAVHSGRWDGAASPDERSAELFRTQGLIAEETGYLAKLGCHRTWVDPGGGYAPHADAHDVALVPLEGRFETQGQEVGPGSVVFFAAGESHGLRNVSEAPAQYLVLEFHGRGEPLPKQLWLARALQRFGPWKRLPARAGRALWRRSMNALGSGKGGAPGR